MTHSDIPSEENTYAHRVAKQNEESKPDFFKRNTGQRITQEELVPHILKVLYKHGGRAKKSQVDEELHEQFKDTFEQNYYQELVSHGVPRWQHFIAYAKESAKLNYGYIKRPDESGRGMWELTTEGTREAEKLSGA